MRNGRGCIASTWQLREKFPITRRLFLKTPRQGEIEGLGIHSVRVLVVRALYCSIWAARTHAKRNNCVLLQVQQAVTRALLPRQLKLAASSSACEKCACDQGKRLDDSVGGTTTSSSRSDSSSTSCAMLLAYHTATRMPSIASPVCALQRQHLYFFFLLPVQQVN